MARTTKTKAPSSRKARTPRETPKLTKASARSKAPARRKTRASTKKAKRKSGNLFYFGKSRTDGDGSMRELLGGKGANLAEMTSIGLPVPPGFTITTATCKRYNDDGGRMPPGLMDDVNKAVNWLENETGKHFGSTDNPLLVSVRSGAAASMPGMMDTVLNLGLNDESVLGLAKLTGAERFAWDAYRRLINMFGDVVMGVDHSHFEKIFERIKKRYKADTDTDVPAEGMKLLCEEYKKVYERYVKKPFPQDPMSQLQLSIEAVFKSWNTPRAVRYRQINEITGLPGTAVNVQSMVFGNMGEDCGTGVAFTRNPSTGENLFFGEFLVNAQGEDVVAGIRTPQPVAKMPKWNDRVYNELLAIKQKLEKHYRDIQDIEFTIERGTLFMLQTRTGKRTGPAAVRIACEMVKERLISRDEALLRVPANDLTQLLLPSFDPQAKKKATVLTKGLPASPGAAVGKLAFTAKEVVARAEKGEAVLLVRKDTSPEDVDGMHSAAGILTSTGGMTSHAAVVARGWGKCCIAGAGDAEIDAEQGTLRIGRHVFDRDSTISIDGGTGEVLEGDIATKEASLSGDFDTLMDWADKRRRLKIRANADSPTDAARARRFGAEGIGLCRTEHMFFGGDRILAMQEMILAETDGDRERALAKLLPYQRSDFEGILKAMDGLPVTIRLLDPPLHEFLPHTERAQSHLAEALRLDIGRLRQRVSELRESNPMLGHRGCRLAVTYPGILRMQVRAIVEATIQCVKRGVKAKPEIMIPLVGIDRELSMLRAEVADTIAVVKKEKDFKGRLQIPIGTMIEIPRAAITARAIAKHAEFFSFGTNDLTQLTFGFSRDDVNTFLPTYLKEEILLKDPFQSLDTVGVGSLVDFATREGRAAVPGLHVGICGEHGGDPASVAFCDKVGLDYVSCSPFRVPVARLAAAQAVLNK